MFRSILIPTYCLSLFGLFAFWYLCERGDSSTYRYTNTHTRAYARLSLYLHPYTRSCPSLEEELSKNKPQKYCLIADANNSNSREKFFLPSNVEAASHSRRRRRTTANSSNNNSPHVKRVLPTLPSASGAVRETCWTGREDTGTRDRGYLLTSKPQQSRIDAKRQ